MTNQIKDQLEETIIKLTFEENIDTFVNVFDILIKCQGGYARKTINDEILFRNQKLNFTGGFHFQSDPVTKSVMIASALVGASNWMYIFPNLLKSINKQWKN